MGDGAESADHGVSASDRTHLGMPRTPLLLGRSTMVLKWDRFKTSTCWSRAAWNRQAGAFAPAFLLPIG